MPSKNVVKVYAPDSYYHIYNRGVEKRTVFETAEDYSAFLNLFKRYLMREPEKDRFGRLYDNLSDEVELLAYCLLPNHFHLLVYQYEADGMTRLMRRVMSAYVQYFNEAHDNRVGGLFQSAFKASLIDQDKYLWHISRYIHLNSLDAGSDPATYPYSSFPYYLGQTAPQWLHPERITAMHEEHRIDYGGFVYDYHDYKQTLDTIKRDLAD